MTSTISIQHHQRPSVDFATLSDAARRVRSKLVNRRVLLLAGGSSSEREGSLEDATELSPILEAFGAKVTQVDPVNTKELLRLVPNADLVYIGLYGGAGEDGTIQGFLEAAGIPYQGSGVHSSAVCMNKLTFKSLAAAWGFRTPKTIHADNLCDPPAEPVVFVAKPVSGGDSFGIRLIDSGITRTQLSSLVKEITAGEMLVEEYVVGQAGTVGIIEVGDTILPSPPLNFQLPPNHLIYDSNLKYQGHNQLQIAPFHGPAADEVVSDAILLYRRLNCRGAARIDFVRTADGPVFLEVNTLPGMYRGSNLALSFNGLDFEDIFAASLYGACAHL